MVTKVKANKRKQTEDGIVAAIDKTKEIKIGTPNKKVLIECHKKVVNNLCRKTLKVIRRFI